MPEDCKYRFLYEILNSNREFPLWQEFIDYYHHCDCYWHCFFDSPLIDVYLSDYQFVNGRYNLILDFYTLFDYYNFKYHTDRSGLKIEEPIPYDNIPRLSTYFYISRYRSDSPLHQGNYKLNLNVLMNYFVIDVQTSKDQGSTRPPIFMAFLTAKDGAKPDTPLLIPTEPFAYPQWVFSNQFRQPSFPHSDDSKYTLRVNDVGQGNWVEILRDDKRYLMVDIGTNAWKKDVSADISHQLTLRSIDSPVHSMIISHWHADHFNILLGMNHSEHQQIGQLICPSVVRNLSAFNLIRYYNSRQPNALFMLNHPWGVKWQCHSSANSPLRLYVRPYVKTNTNNSGILVNFATDASLVSVPGDANYSMVQSSANDALNAYSKTKTKYYLVVPHHGGKAGVYKKGICGSIRCKEAIISVGHNNPYDHPDDDIFDKLKADFARVSLTRSRKKTKFIDILL